MMMVLSLIKKSSRNLWNPGRELLKYLFLFVTFPRRLQQVFSQVFIMAWGFCGCYSVSVYIVWEFGGGCNLSHIEQGISRFDHFDRSKIPVLRLLWAMATSLLRQRFELLFRKLCFLPVKPGAGQSERRVHNKLYRSPRNSNCKKPVC